jgi:hypothetical protein
LQGLQRHLDRKTPCERKKAAVWRCGCRETFGRQDSLERHRKRACPLAAKQRDDEKRLHDLTRKVQSLEEQLKAARTTPVIQTFSAHNLSQTTIQTSITNHIHVNAWDGQDRLVVSLDLLKEVLRENSMLREYRELPEVNRYDPEFVSPYVLEALMAVIRRAHRLPDGRNIRQNPSRADQVQVLVREGGERWEILTLVDAVRLLFRDAARQMLHLANTSAALRELTPEERSATSLLPAEYRRRPEKYEREGKSRMAAHLADLGAGSAAAPGRRDPEVADRGGAPDRTEEADREARAAGPSRSAPELPA